MKYRRLIPVVLVLIAGILAALIPAGCRAAYAWSADRVTKPVIEAIEAYKTLTGRLPATLSDLSALPGAQKALKLEGHSDVGLVWSINYRNMSNGTYVVSFNHVHYDVWYTNGKRDDIRFNFFR